MTDTDTSREVVAARRATLGAAVTVILAMGVLSLPAQTTREPAVPADFAGVYQATPSGAVLPGNLRNVGSPADITLLPGALQAMKTVDLRQDPMKMCQPIGPFRMMARDSTKIEIVPAHGMIVMLYEDLARGLLRTIYLTRPHPRQPVLNWLGDSVGRWEGTTLVVDTVGFNERTWLNDAGAPHSEALHLVERIRPVLGGKYLEYRVTADDPKTLVKPYTYVRYYEKLKTGIAEDVCEADE